MLFRSNNIDVPNAVLTAFNSQYPTVSNPTWEYKDPYYVAEFKSGATETDVWYQANGTMMLTIVDMPAANLPQLITTAIASSPYKAWSYDDAVMIQRDGFVTLYKVEMENPSNKDEVTLYYSEEGVLVKEVPEIDNTPLNPVVIPQKIMDQINANFPSSIYKIIDYDIDATTKYYEVDLYVDNLVVEVLFDANQKLLYWEWETTYVKVTDVVKKAFLDAGYTQEQIDDIYYRETPDADPRENVTTYVFELDVNGKDVVVIFNENGKQLQ